MITHVFKIPACAIVTRYAQFPRRMRAWCFAILEHAVDKIIVGHIRETQTFRGKAYGATASVVEWPQISTDTKIMGNTIIELERHDATAGAGGPILYVRSVLLAKSGQGMSKKIITPEFCWLTQHGSLLFHFAIAANNGNTWRVLCTLQELLHFCRDTGGKCAITHRVIHICKHAVLPDQDTKLIT